MTKISIITTSLNQVNFIGQTLESVRTQQYPDVEHLVMDGSSTDGTIAMLQEKSGTEWLHLKWSSEPDSGQSEAMNKGFRMATGEIIGWLNSDDCYRPGCLERVAQAFAENPDVDVFYGDYTFMDETGTLTRIRREIEFSYFILLYHFVPYIPTTATFFRRKIFDDGNFLDENLHYAMDHEFFVRLASRGYRFRHLPTVLADFRLHPASKTCTMARMQLKEKQMATLAFSPLARKMQANGLYSIAFLLLQASAAVMRYGEKFLRGYYWTQRRPSSLKT